MYKSSEYPFLYYFSIFDPFTDRLSAGMTGRKGGVSRQPFGSFNLALHCGDDDDAVLENRNRLCEALKIDISSYTCAEQIHSSEAKAVGTRDMGSGAISYGTSIRGTDALMTDRRGILMNIHIADCVPLIIYDPENHAGALVHAGWKGTASRVAQKTVLQMKETYGSRPESMIAALGPSIGSCCFEIGDDTADKLQSGFPYEKNIIIKKEGSTYADLWIANGEQLLRAGLKKENIESARICTSCHTEEFYSYRADRGKTGRFSAYLLLK
ncbi:MAG: peptidoglycan editing factor PgeF [Spirochaetales bacterium]|nr:peptidoglycan editing factor PgeF [Spirochaetales bacterium]